MILHPESDRLRHALERFASRAVRWSGVVYRSASPRYANKDDLLTGVGSKTAGGRWNPPKSFPTVYSSLDQHPALDEVLANFRYYAFPIESAMPRVSGVIGTGRCFCRYVSSLRHQLRKATAAPSRSFSAADAVLE